MLLDVRLSATDKRTDVADASPTMAGSRRDVGFGEAGAWNDRGCRHWQAGEREAALDCFRKAVRLQPNFAAALTNLGCALKAVGRLDDAIAAYRSAIMRDPSLADAHNNLGCALMAANRTDEANDCFKKAVELQPNFADAYCNWGASLRSSGQVTEAISCHQKAVEIRPESFRSCFELGGLLHEQKQYAEAISWHERAIQLKPQAPEALNNLGCAYKEARNFTAAVDALRRSMEANPSSVDAFVNLGGVYTELGDYTVAAACFRQALELRPTSNEAQLGLGIIDQHQGQIEKAIASFDAVLDRDPKHVEAHLNRAFAWLASGNFAQGWPEYEWRLRFKDYPTRTFTQPQWDGSPLAGRRLLVHIEQGLGDTLQFVRFIPRLCRSHNGIVLLGIQKALTRLLECSGFGDLIVRGAELPDFDVHAPLMSLPHLLKLDRAGDLASPPYLKTNLALVEAWRKRFASEAETKFRIGIHWQGNPKYQLDYARSIPLKCFERLTDLATVRLYSLQQGFGSEQVDEFRGATPLVNLGKSLDRGTGAFVETAAVMQNLDLVISSDTATAHLAGALGVPVWVPLPFFAEWRWLTSGDFSPWYASMRLFRQSQPGDWRGVFENIRRQLEAIVPQQQAATD